MKTWLKGNMGLRALAWGFSSLLVGGPGLGVGFVQAQEAATPNESGAQYTVSPPLINASETVGDRPNVLLVVDNSGSMNETPEGLAVPGSNPSSKSEILRSAARTLVEDFGNRTNIGVMTFNQSPFFGRRNLYAIEYNVSYDPLTFDPNTDGSNEAFKRFRVPNATAPGNFIHFNSETGQTRTSNIGANLFCFARNPNTFLATLQTFQDNDYDCYARKTNTRDDFSGFESFVRRMDISFGGRFAGNNVAWQLTGRVWVTGRGTGRGTLELPIAQATGSHREDLLALLATEQYNVSTNVPIRNASLTPIEGTLRSARHYFEGTLPSTDARSGVNLTPPEMGMCQQQDYVVLVTDGFPTQNADGTTGGSTTAKIDRSAEEARRLREQGVLTFVVGFAINGDTSLLDRIAVAGGTDAAFIAEDASALGDALGSIFLSLNRSETSAASSAVISSNARGEGAIYQALYSPQISRTVVEIEDGEVRENSYRVTWVGNLFGLFIDDNGFLREDTNGNDTLDDYGVDRVAEFFFNEDPDSEGFGTTQVRLFSGSGDVPPDLSSASFSVVDLTDVRTLWEARDELNNVDDVVSQRNYSDTADTGRHILTTFDRESLTDFVLPDVLIEQAEEEAQAALDLAQLDVDQQQAFIDSLPLAIQEVQGQVNTSLESFAASTEARINAETDLSDATSARIFAESEVERTAQELVDAEQAVVDAEAALNLAQTDVDGAQSDVDAQALVLAQAQADLDTAIAAQTAGAARV